MEIYPNIGVGSLRFGMTRDQVRHVLSVEPKVFFKTDPTVGYATDAFDELLIHVYYGKDERFDCVEFGPDALVTIDGRSVVGIAFSAACSLLRELDPLVERDDVGLVSRRLGVSIYCLAAAEDEGARVEGVMVCEPGYWERD